MTEPFRYKLFDLHTQQYILTNPHDPDSALIEEINNSLLEKILPESARDRLSVATIEMGMTGAMISNNHPDSENNVLLLAKGSRGIYGPAEYRELLAPYLDLVTDYPYQRYLTNENVSLHTDELKIWVVDDERGISGVDGIDSKTAANILGDSHGKMSLKVAESVGSPENLMQYRLAAADLNSPWFAKGTLAPSLQNTLKQFKLSKKPELEGIDIILPTSSLKGVSKENLTPGVHTVEVHLAHHEMSRERNFTLRSVVEKLDGDPLTSAIKQQQQEIEKLNSAFSTTQTLNEDFLKFLEPRTMPDPDRPEIEIDFDPERWEKCGDDKYVTFRKDLEGHQQLINSPMFAQDKHKFYASRARKAAQLSFVKAKGGMIFCSSQLKNNEICVPNLPDGAKVAAIRSPIIKLQDISLVENKLIEDIKNDAGKTIKGAIVCSPQTYEALLFQTKNFIQQQTKLLNDANIDTQQLDSLNPWRSDRYQNAVLSQIEGTEREELTTQLNQWRIAYNDLVVNNQRSAPQLDRIRQDTFTAIIKGDFDGDNIAILTQQQYPAIYAGIADRISQSDSYTAKLDKIKVTGTQELGDLLADKADPYILGKTANLAENLQSLAVAADRVEQSGSEEQQLKHLQEIAPSYYYMMANPTSEDIKAADANKVLSTYRFYDIASTGNKLIDPKLVERFDAYGLDKALLTINAGGTVEPAVRQRLFATWKDLLLNVTEAAAEQNQIAVDTFKSERPIDRDLVEGLTKRFQPLDDGLKKVLKNNQTYLEQVPQLNNAVTNRALLVNNVTQNLVDYQPGVANYQQIQGLFPVVEDEFIKQEVARISNEYDKLTSMASKVRAKARIDAGPSLNFVDGAGRNFEVTNILAADRTVDSLKAELVGGETNIRLEPSDDPNKPHQFVALYDRGGSWEPFGTVCNACAQSLELEPEMEHTLSEVNGFRFSSSSAVHVADTYSQQAYRIVEDWRGKIPDAQVNDYAAATYNHLTSSYSQSNRLNLMLRAFGPQLSKRVEQLHLNQINVNNLTKNKATGKIPIAFVSDPQNTERVEVMHVEADGSLTKLGNISLNSHAFAPGTTAIAEASYTPPSIGDITLNSGEQLTIGGMAKSSFATAGTIFAEEELELEAAPGTDLTLPILKVRDSVIGRLSDSSAAYLENNQLLDLGQNLDLSLTTIGKGASQKIQATTGNGKVLEIVHLQEDFKIPRENERVSATVAFQKKRSTPQLFAYYQGKKVAVGEFNYGTKGSHRRSLQQLKDLGLYGKPFKAKLNSRVTTVNLTLEPDSIVYNRDSELAASIPKIVESSEKNVDTDDFLQQQQQYNRYGVIRPRDFMTPDGEVKRVMSLDVVIDRSSVEEGQAPADLADFELINDGNIDIEQETKKGFTVYSLPVEHLGITNSGLVQERFNLSRIEDLSGNELARLQNYQQRIKDSYPDLVEFEENMPGMEGLFVPQLTAPVGNRQPKPTMSQNLLSAIELKDVLPAETWQQNLDLSYFDYTWLTQTLDLDKNLSQPKIIQQAFTGENLAELQATVSGYITTEGELVYQHLEAATDKRWAAELESTLGKTRYEHHKAKARSLLAAGTIPVVLHRNGEGKTPAKLITKRPATRIKLPETIDKNLAAPITIGADSEFGLALNNPSDRKNPDLAHPIDFDGQTHPSVQHAYSEIVNRDGVPQRQTYGLIRNLMTAKLKQYPQIVEGIESRGGYKWLYSCNHVLPGNDFWSGEGKDSALIGVLSSSFKQAKSSSKEKSGEHKKKVITLKSGAKRQINFPKKQQVDIGVEQQPQKLNIAGKPISMNYSLMRQKPIAVSDCFEALRGHGRTHTTRNFEPFKAYDLQSGDLAIAYKGSRDNPIGQVVLRIGQQYQLTKAMLNDAKFQKKWAEREQHDPETLPKLFEDKMVEGKEVWGMTFEPLGDLVNGEILDFATGKEINIVDLKLPNKTINSPSDSRAGNMPASAQVRDLSKSIQQIGTLDRNTQDSVLEHLSKMKSSLNTDVSQYAKGRQNFWLGTQWNLKDKQFQPSGTWNSQLWELCKKVYPDADIGLITYSGDETSAGIDLHRDDSYAAFEARSVSIETVPGQTTKWQMQQTYPAMGWVDKQNSKAPISNFELPSGSITSFNCKNPHAAFPGKGRWSINLWKVSNKERENYQNHIDKNGIHGGAVDRGLELPSIPLPAAINLTAESRALLNNPPLSTTESTVKPTIEVAPPIVINKPSEIAMISVPNLAAASDFQTANHNIKSSGQSELKGKINQALKETVSQIRLLDTVKVWQKKNHEIGNSNSVIANFSDAPSAKELNYRAALIGRETGQKAVMTFREDVNGTDTLASINVPNHIDAYELRSKLKELNIANFTLIPTPKFTKVVISDRDGSQLPKITELAKTYDTQLKLTQGRSSIIKEREYARTIESFKEKNRGVSRAGDSDRPNQQGGRNESLDSNLNRDGRGITPKSKKIAPNLKQAIVPKIKSPAAVQDELTQKAIPILRELLELNPGQRQYTDGNIVVNYDGGTKTLSLVDLHSSQLKMSATHDGQRWQSNSQYVGGMTAQDIPLLKAAVIIAKNQTPTPTKIVPEPAKNLFKEEMDKLAHSAPTAYANKDVER